MIATRLRGPLLQAAVALLAVATLAPAGGAHGGNVTGLARKNGKRCVGSMIWDSRASETIIARDWATKIGLLNPNGTPNGAAGSLKFGTGGGAIDTWCFTNVVVAALDDRNEFCTSTETVYVAKDPASGAASLNVLGRPWQAAVDGWRRARGDLVYWPCTPPNDSSGQPAPSRDKTSRTDSQTGHTHQVLEQVFWGRGTGQLPIDMVIKNWPYTFLPESFALAAGGVPVGQMDLPQVDPEAYTRLTYSFFNGPGQTVFPLMQMPGFDLGLGPPGQPILVLAFDDATSDFGIIGDGMLLQEQDPDHDYMHAPGQGQTGEGALYFGITDCNQNGVHDDLEIQQFPNLDQDGNLVIDACQVPTGGACFLPEGQCEEVTDLFAQFDGNAIYGGDFSDCQSIQCQPTVFNYCTAGTTTNGCQATMVGIGNPSATAGSGFDLFVAGMEGQKQGILFYGVNGQTALPWGGSSSFLCVKAPTQRTGAQGSGGTAGLCDGQMSIDWNAYIAANPGALGQPFSAGDTAWAQGWFRDPPSPKTTHLSDGIEFVLMP